MPTEREKGLEMLTSMVEEVGLGPSLHAIADFLGCAGRWTDAELGAREAAAKEFSQRLADVPNKGYWDQCREELVWDKAAMVAIHFHKILYEAVVLMVYSAVEQSLKDALRVYCQTLEGRKCSPDRMGFDEISKRLDDIVTTLGWPSLRSSSEWERIDRWRRVRNALVHTDGCIDDLSTVEDLQEHLGLQFEDAGMGLCDTWRVELTGDNCTDMLNDSDALFQWLAERTREYVAKCSANGE